ncbi:hypothetical protein BX600DRAFT_443221 [Xylariales sp. PMI_506]|nr:hypothetical protein BX600DRAFT_443221 [Xylariales sp. PMI_506]
MSYQHTLPSKFTGFLRTSKSSDYSTVAFLMHPSGWHAVIFAASREPAPPSARVRTIDFTDKEKLFAIVIEDVLTAEECQEVLSLVQPAGADSLWPRTTLTAYGSQEIPEEETTRKCDRVVLQSPPLAEALPRRIHPFLQERVLNLHDDVDITGPYPVVKGETWRLARLREGLRFLRYRSGDYFRRHCDGMFTDKQRSFLTVHLYLNDQGLEGGATRFLPDGGDPNGRHVEVDPKMGSVLVFQQRDMWHEGCEVTKGFKYTVRTDAIYEKV